MIKESLLTDPETSLPVGRQVQDDEEGMPVVKIRMTAIEQEGFRITICDLELEHWNFPGD